MNWFKNLKIGVKLLVSFVFISMITALVGYVGISSIHKLEKADSKLYNSVTAPMSEAEALMYNFQQIRVACRDMIMLNDINAIEKRIEDRKGYSANITRLAQSFEKNIISEEGRKLFRDFTENRKQYLLDLKEIEGYARENKDKEGLDFLSSGSIAQTEKNELDLINQMVEMKVKLGKDISDSNTALASSASSTMLILVILGCFAAIGFGYFISNLIKRPVQKLLNMAEELFKGHVKARANVEIKDEIGIAAGVLDKFAQQLEDFTTALHKAAEGDASVSFPVYDNEDRIAPSLNKLASTLRDLIAEINSLTLAAKQGRLDVRGNADKFSGGYREIITGINDTLGTIVNEIKEASLVLETVANGDLTVRVEGEKQGFYGQYQDVVNNLADSLGSLISEVQMAVQATASSAAEISSSSEQMAAGSHEQSQQVTEVAGAIEEMTRTIIETSGNVTEAASLSERSSREAEKGFRKIEETKYGIERIVRSADETAFIISSLTKKSDQIGEITQVIDDIADQTNLLALNAAIEAARAGEQGRGFAVVADEVRKLAERTTKATKEIADTIKAIQDEAKHADSSMSNAKSAVIDGMKLTEEVAGVLNEILKGAKKANDVVGQVAAASEQQSATAEQISKNIDGVSAVTQQSAAGTEQIAKAAEDLNRLTVNLQGLISNFKIHNNSPKSIVQGPKSARQGGSPQSIVQSPRSKVQGPKSAKRKEVL
ncbi:MAG: methyl-accepting chemotaxis protein [Bacillota bacterium]